MIFVDNHNNADICVSASTAGFWVRGSIIGNTVDIHLLQMLSVKFFLMNLERTFLAKGFQLMVFDMTGRVEK